MKRNARIVNWIFSCFYLLGILFLMDCSHIPGRRSPIFDTDADVLGVWWWWVNPEKSNSHMDFAARNGVNEIYYHTPEFNRRTGAFIQRAQSRGIKVFFLLGGYKEIWDYAMFDETMDRFLAYQASAPGNRKFAGLHLDIEPQIHPEYDTNYMEFLQDYIDFVVRACDKYKGQTSIDLDIAWWFDVEIDYRGEKTMLYQALISEADRVFVMSYKDTAERTYEVAKEEVAFAKSINKQIILGAETGPFDEEPGVSFYGESSAYLYEQLTELSHMMDYCNYGISIHHITTWYSMAP